MSPPASDCSRSPTTSPTRRDGTSSATELTRPSAHPTCSSTTPASPPSTTAPSSTASTSPLDEWNAVLAVNLTGAFLGIRALAPAMQRGGYGRIVNVASLAARNGGRIGGVHYAATKTGLLGLTRSFARELAACGITVNAVAPGRIDAGMVAMTSTRFNDDYRASIPVGRLGTAADVARAVAFLTDAESGFITGTTTDVNGGGHMQ
ncbi:SDR family oxidoreductase [Leucobacter muris]|uniref:SDR family oxidoreductase n=2 Tax=Leucobacter TaxID=55968 RepID=A0ABX5QHQ7_9MICO|nr:SDR family oxidoreductase [Leucobacter muris]